MAASTSSSEMIFDLKQVHDNFLSCLVGIDDISLSTYLDGYKELNKFFQLMGTVFGFVSSDITQKIEILEKYISDMNQNVNDKSLQKSNTVENIRDKSEVKNDETEKLDDFEVINHLDKVNLNDTNNLSENNFKTLHTMLLYEQNEGLLEKKDYVSGARTLLRLHRGLDFIREFLSAVGNLNNNDKTSTMCQEVYNRTLAQHHTWIIRKGAAVAMYTMPTRAGLLKRVCRSESDIQKTLDILPKMLEATNEVYNRTQVLYEQYNLLNLP